MSSPHFNYKQPRRCHWFENDGSPRTQKDGAKGCVYRSCHFIHPDHPAWATAVKTRPDPPPVPVRDVERDRDRDRYKDLRDFSPRDRDRDRDIDRFRDRDRDRDRETWDRDKDRGREHDGARSPRAASSGPNTSASKTRDTKPLCTAVSSSPATAMLISSSNSTSFTGNSPLKSASTSTIPARNISGTTTSVANRVRSPSLPRTSSASASAAYPRESNFSYSDRGSYRDRDKSPSTPTDARSRVYRQRQNSTASVTAAHPQASTYSSSPATANPMPPPPPTLKLATPQSSSALSPSTAPPLSTSAGPTATTANGSSQELSRGDKIQLWVDRIKQLSDAVQVRTQHVALDRELVQLKTLLTSRQYANLSEAARANLEKQVKATEDRYIAKRSELNELVYKLVDSQFWDASLTWSGFSADTSKGDPKGKGKERDTGWGDPEAKGSAVGERFKELSTVVWQVRDGVAELYKMMEELKDTSGAGEQPSARRRRPNDAMDVDESTVKSTASDRTTSSLLRSAKRLPSPPRELEPISDRLNAIDERVADLENTIVQFESDFMVQFEERMEERLQELNLHRSGGNDDAMAIDDEPPDTGQSTTGQCKTAAERLQYVEIEMERAGADLTGIAHEIAEIITKAQITDDEVTRLKKENQEMKERIAVLEKQSLESAEALKAFKAEMEALNAALQTFISHPTSPPPAPPPQLIPPPVEVLPDLETILETVAPRVLQSVREDIVPMLEDLQESVQTMTTRQNTQLAQNVMNKLQLTFKTVEVIYAWMNRTVAAQMPPPPAPVGGSPIVVPPAQVPLGTGASNGVPNGTPVGTMLPPTTGSSGRVATPALLVRNGVPPQVPTHIPPQAIPTKTLPQ